MTTNASSPKPPREGRVIALTVAATSVAGQEDEAVDGGNLTSRRGRTFWNFLVPEGGLHMIFGALDQTIGAATTSDPLIPAGIHSWEIDESCMRFSALSPSGSVQLDRWPG